MVGPCSKKGISDSTSRRAFERSTCHQILEKTPIFVVIKKATSFYKHLHWQASSPLERQDIQKNVGLMAKRHIHCSGFAIQKMQSSLVERRTARRAITDQLALVYLSRISPMKNLDFLLGSLSRIEVPLELSIYGPLEDKEYWSKCQNLLKIFQAEWQ